MIAFIYHQNCADGFGAAFAAHLLTGGRHEGQPIIYAEGQHGFPPPEIPEEAEIVMADISYDLETMLRLHQRHRGRVTLLDHHKTALEQLAGRLPPNYTIDLNRSGARLAWDYWASRLGRPATPRHPLIDYVEDRDLWRWRLPGSREVSAALAAKPREFAVWEKLEIPSLIEEGARLLAEQRRETARLADAAAFIDLAGYRIPAAETAELASEVCEELRRRHPEAPFAAAWRRSEQGGRKWSLRNSPGFDVSEIARRFGGGGHAQAAGFRD